MTMDSVSHENVEKLLKDKEEKENLLKKIEKTTIEKMWLNDLQELEKILNKK